MKSHAQVVVIGGGVVGCSVLFHLARHGWTDLMAGEAVTAWQPDRLLPIRYGFEDAGALYAAL